MAEISGDVAAALRELTDVLKKNEPAVWTTQAELDEAPVGTIVIDRAGFPFLKIVSGHWVANGVTGAWPARDLEGPLRAIWVPWADTTEGG